MNETIKELEKIYQVNLQNKYLIEYGNIIGLQLYNKNISNLEPLQNLNNLTGE